ncbi:MULTISPECIES: dTMP kinase [unclassified Nitrosospira]|uniref:dTMP kinase n=1 Tax=unclassified Nitrosospira TaxID=2609267 RepID=UPI000D303672|nr:MULTISPECIES: dTMP kinase [unclassified Nitrosospira]WON73653.1 dTMP kinase [Nitrosospira sp. Is2]
MTASKTITGKFITLEGIDGAGKSTHLHWFEKVLRDKGKTVVVTREPGGTRLGEALRQLLLDTGQAMHAETEALLMFAARREHLDKVIMPGLERGDWVISDRFTDASFAYQGGGRGLAATKLAELEHWVQGEFQPDLTFYFDVAVEVGRQRTSAIKLADRFEKETDTFFNRVREAYLERARQFPQRIRVIDANLSLVEVHKQLDEVLLKLCDDYDLSMAN